MSTAKKGNKAVESTESSTFLERNEFLIRRLHSLAGLIPVGAYMCIHLLTNASVLDSPGRFQSAVYQIHSLGAALPVVEWGFIFLPLLFHMILGVVIIRGGLPNSGAYRYTSNIRYSLQRGSGMVAMVFILWHVFHMHGWLHNPWWLENVAQPFYGAQFSPFNAASTAGAALGSFLVTLLYAVGVLSCVFHLANGVWTMGITWGVWVSPAAQQRANVVCTLFGVGLAVVGLSALWGMKTVDQNAARQVEQKMLEAKLVGGEITEEEAAHKSAPHAPPTEASAAKVEREAETRAGS